MADRNITACRSCRGPMAIYANRLVHRYFMNNHSNDLVIEIHVTSVISILQVDIA